MFCVVIKGGMPGAATFKDCKTLESIVKKQALDNRPYAAICAAPAVALGSWGLLKGLKVRNSYFYYVAFTYFILCKLCDNGLQMVDTT